MSRILATVTSAGGLLAASQTVAEDHDMTPTHETDSGPLLWHNEGLTYLYDKNFKANPPVQQTLILERASSWTWGDLFIFFDRINYNGKEGASNDKNTYYGEITLRLGSGKLTGADLLFSPTKDVLLASTYEFSEGDTKAYLLGSGLDLAILGFDYFQPNFYYRKSGGNCVHAGAWQITPVWSYTVPAGSFDIPIDGYIDWVINNKSVNTSHRSQSDYHANLHFNPQVEHDLSKAPGYKVKHLYVGLEYDCRSDKYGVKDSQYPITDQNTVSFLVRYHFWVRRAELPAGPYQRVPSLRTVRRHSARQSPSWPLRSPPVVRSIHAGRTLQPGRQE